jgi:hypothetical protein
VLLVRAVRRRRGRRPVGGPPRHRHSRESRERAAREQMAGLSDSGRCPSATARKSPSTG